MAQFCVSRQILTILKTILVMQAFFPFVLSLMECPSGDLSALDYRCSLKIDDTDFEIQCYNYTLHEDVPENWDQQFSMHFQVSFSTIDIDQDFTQSLRTAITKTSSQIVKYYACNRGPEKKKTSNIFAATKYCSAGYDCYHLFPNIIEDQFIRSIEILNQQTVRFGNLAGMLNVNVLSVTRAKALVFTQQAQNSVSSIEKLYLRGNYLTNIPQNFLLNNTGLKYLDVSDNLISRIDTDVFKNIYNLSHLNFGNNAMEELLNDTFYSLPNLAHIYLDSNAFRSIPSTIFRRSPLLNTIAFSNNDIASFPEDLLWDLKYLKHLFLSRCKLKQLRPNFFRDTVNMEKLDLSHNKITDLPETILRRMEKLDSLDLSHNQFTYIPEKLFSNLFKLTSLNLMSNEINLLPEKLLSTTVSLLSLDLSDNKLETFTEDFVKDAQMLQVLNLSRNKITSIGLGLYRTLYLETLNVSMNDILDFGLMWKRLPYLKHVDFSYNRISDITLPSCIENMPEGVTQSMQHNNISRVFIRTHSRQNSDKCIRSDLQKAKILLSDNPLNCDCRLLDFYRYLAYKKTFYSFPDQGNWTCMYPTVHRGKKFTKLEEYVFICQIEDDCPKPCNCGTRTSDNSTVLDCSSLNLEEINGFTPVNTTVLYFQNNRLNDLKNLKITNWDNIVELWLDNNLLESIETSHLPNSLQILSVRHNKFRTMSESLLNIIEAKGTFAIYMENNTWVCNCEILKFKYWLQNYSSIVTDSENVTCLVERTGDYASLYKILDQDLCPTQTNDINLTVITISIFSVLAITILSLVSFYCGNKQTMLAYAYIHFGCLFRCFFGKEELDESKEFDAFIAYNSNDREVVMAIIEELENNEPFFKLCIHERDWTAGICISENIVHSVQNSRRTIIMLSEDFVASMWFVVEVRAVLFQMSQDKFYRLIVIVIGNFPSMDTLDEDIQQLLRRKTYLEWGKRWFWEKLRYSMPHNSNYRTNISKDKRKQEAQLVENEVAFSFDPNSKQTVSSLETENL